MPQVIQTPEPITSIQNYFARRPASATIGVFACGHDMYWPQFPKLQDRLLRWHAEFVDRLRALGVKVIDGGMSDSSRSVERVLQPLERGGIDLLIANVVTYSASAWSVPIIQRLNRPTALVGLQPAARLRYEAATTFDQLCNDNSTSLPELTCALNRCGCPPVDVVFGQLGEARAWGKLATLCDQARCLHVLRRGRIGLMGHTYEGMLDMNSDPTMFTAQLGLHVEHLEIDDLAQRVDAVGDAAVDQRLDLIHELFHFPPPGSDPIAGKVDPAELAWAARVSLGLENLVNDLGLDGLSYYYRGKPNTANERLGCSLTVGSSLLTGRGVPIAGEFDTRTCVAMLIMDRLGAGGSFAELHPADFDEDFVLVGHDGPHHIAIAQGKPVLRGLSVLHGKAGRGPSVEFALKSGPITMLSITQTAGGRFKFIIAEGQSLAGPIPATGNTNTRGKFQPDVRTFVERWSLAGPSHHFALGVGHHARVLEQLAKMLGLECETVVRES
jgi:L-arabinose isomerase